MATKINKRKTKPSKVKKAVSKVEAPVEETPVLEPKGEYKLEIDILNEKLVFYTDDLVKTILDVKPAKITNKVILKVTKGDRTWEKVFFVIPARRLFKIPLATQFFVKNIKLALD